jgi:hypothetical protein
MKQLPKPSHYKVRGKITQATHVLPFDWEDAVPHYTIDECNQMFKLSGLSVESVPESFMLEDGNGEYVIYASSNLANEAHNALLEQAYHDGKLEPKAIKKAIGEQFKLPRWELFD